MQACSLGKRQNDLHPNHGAVIDKVHGFQHQPSKGFIGKMYAKGARERIGVHIRSRNADDIDVYAGYFIPIARDNREVQALSGGGHGRAILVRAIDAQRDARENDPIPRLFLERQSAGTGGVAMTPPAT